MKEFLVLFFMFFLSNVLFASPKYLEKKYFYTDEYGSVKISSDLLEFEDGKESGVLIEKKYFTMFLGDKYNYIILDCIVDEIDFLTIVKKDIHSKFEYSGWEMTYNEILNNSEYKAAKLVPFSVIKAVSFITEKGKNGKEIRFLPEEYNFFSLGSNPWAVKKDDKKVIYLSTERWRHPTTVFYPVSDIVFVNGFVYPDKDYLYEQNSRAKRVRISYNDTSFETELQDTGNFQLVHLPVSIDPKANNNVRIEILDSYPGSKYSDIVISGVYYMDAVVKW